MKVRDVMQASTVSVNEDSLIKHVARLIFTGTIYSFPVVRGKKLVGFITEEDIFFGMQSASKDNNYNGKKLVQVLEKPVRELMIKDVISVAPDTNLIDAQTLMYKHNFAQLPVVEKKGELVGVITRADIFRHVLEEELPKLESSQYASFMSENYDQMIDWDLRVENEFPTLFRVFQKHNVKNVLDVGSWTGEYAVRLAKEGVSVVGLDHNPLMISFSNSKKAKLPKATQQNISFQLTDFNNISGQIGKASVDAVISVGTSLAYVPKDPESVLSDLYKVTRKNGVLVMQLLNMEKVVEKKGRFLSFRMKQGEKGGEQLSIEFFDKKGARTLRHNVIKFFSDGQRWIFAGINSIDISYLKNDEIIKMVERAGYKDINVTGTKSEYRGQFGQMSLVKPFDPLTSDWMTVIAVKK